MPLTCSTASAWAREASPRSCPVASRTTISRPRPPRQPSRRARLTWRAMATSWRDVFDLGDGAAAAAAEGDPEAVDPARPGILGRLRESLSKSRRALQAEIGSSLFDQLDEETWVRLEEALILADVGAKTTADVVGRLEAEVDAGAVSGAHTVRDRLAGPLPPGAGAPTPPVHPPSRPAGWMIAGANRAS